MNALEKLQILEALLFAAPEPLTQKSKFNFPKDAPILDNSIKKLKCIMKKITDHILSKLLAVFK